MGGIPIAPIVHIHPREIHPVRVTEGMFVSFVGPSTVFLSDDVVAVVAELEMKKSRAIMNYAASHWIDRRLAKDQE
jgi:hypothetical protein